MSSLPYSSGPNSNAGPALELVHVAKIFQSRSGDVLALSDVSFQVERGRIVSLVGPSGSGKSTIVNLLAAFERPTDGLIRIQGCAPRTLRPPVRVGVVQQSDSLFPFRTVFDNVAFGARRNGLDGSDLHDAVNRWLSRVGLAEFANKWPRELSGGMKRRAELARALAYEPDILLLDEPFSSLDVLMREEMHDLLLTICADRVRTVLFATHDVEEAVFLSEEVLVLSASPATIAARYLVPFEYPRRPDLRMAPEFVSVRAEITARLKQQRSFRLLEQSHD